MANNGRQWRRTRDAGIVAALVWVSTIGATATAAAPSAAAPATATAAAAQPAVVGQPGAPLVLDKQVTSGPTAAAGLPDTYDLSYTVSVRNISGGATTYDLTDELHFGLPVSIVSRSATNADPSTPAPVAGWNGAAQPALANDVAIADGATHTFAIAVRVSYPRTATPTLTTDCTLDAGEPGTGLRNVATMTPVAGGAITAAACLPIAAPTLGKRGVVVSGPNAGSTTVAEAGDVIQWTVQFANIPESAGEGVSITDAIGAAQSYVAGSLDVPGDGSGGDWTPTYSTVPGSLTPTDYTVGAEPATVEGIGMSHPGNGLPTAFGNSTLFPAPVQGFQGSTAGGDGTYPIFFANNVYNVHHHQAPGGGATLIECHDKSTGAVCAGWPATGSYFPVAAGAAMNTGAYEYVTSMFVGGDYMDAATGRLYIPVARGNVAGFANSEGIACLDLANLVSCGYTQLATTGQQSTDGGDFGGNARIGTRMYPTTRRGDLYCFDVATLAACPGFPVTVAPNGATKPANLGTTLATEAFGQYVFGATWWFSGSARTDAWCYDTVANAMCPGFPKVQVGGVDQMARFIVPLADTTGNVTGACWEMTPNINYPFLSWQCFDVNGVAQVAPAFGVPAAGANTVGTVGFGSPLLLGTKLYLHSTLLPGTGVSRYTCYDFATGAQCVGFGTVTSNTNMQSYSIREDPANPGCLWVVGHVGKFEVFNETGTLGCAVTHASMSITPTDYYCTASPSHITAWDRLFLGNLDPADYAAARLTLRDGGGAIIPGWDGADVTADIAGDGFVSLAGVPYATYPEIQVDLGLTGVDGAPFAGADPPYVNLTWVGDPIEMCYRTLVEATCAEPSVTNTARLGYLPEGQPLQVSTASEDFAYIATDASCFEISKDIADRDYLGNNRWQITYGINVNNPGPAEGRYDLSDALQPGAGITIEPTPTAANTTPGTILTNPAWTGTTPNTAIVTDRAIPAATTHTYEVTSVVVVPGGLAAGAYDCALLPGETGTGTLNMATVSGDAGTPQTDTACSAMVPAYTIAKTSDPDSGDPVAPGDVVTYTLTITNTGDVEVTPAITDDLTDVFDDARYNGDADAGANPDPDITGNTLTWSGPVPVGGAVQITYSVTVQDGDDLGDARLDNVVTGDAISNCPPGPAVPACSTTHPVQAVRYTKQVSTPDVTELEPGADFTYTVLVENIGQVPLAGLGFQDDLSDVLDDATYNGDHAVAGPGSVSYAAPIVSWSGALAVGQSATITYSVTVNGTVTGDGFLRNGVVGGGPGSNCATAASTDQLCSTSVPGPILATVKTASPANPLPGETVTYTITTTNTGTGAALNISIADDLTGVLDDIASGPSAITASLGAAPGYSAPVLEWIGDIPAGGTQVITYSVVVKDAAALAGPGDATLINEVDAPGCPPTTPGAPSDCVTVTAVPAYTIVKTSDPADGAAVRTGDTVEYTLIVTNTGGVDLTPAISDDLSGVLDDATYNGDASASAGIASVTGFRLDWAGPLAIGDVVMITYSVTVEGPDALEDSRLVNLITGDAWSNCPPGSDDEDCTTTHQVGAWDVVKVADQTSVVAGEVITYTITATNVGAVDLAAVDFDDDLTGVLDDATYNGDASASSGIVNYAEPTLSWSGSLPVAGSATMTYTVTVHSPLTGDRQLPNAVVTPGDGPCPTGVGADGCAVDVPARELTIVKDTVPADLAAARPGETVRYRVTISNTGAAAYLPATVTDDLADALDAAAGPNAITVTGPGSASFDGGSSTLTWSGPLQPGEVVTIGYELVVDSPLAGDGLLENVVTSPDPGATCPAGIRAGSLTAACATTTPIQALRVVKQSDVTGQVAIGTVVTYTITVSNTGQAPLAPATFTDDLSGILDDGSLEGTPTASVGTATVAAPILSWSGDLAIGASATVVYRLRISGAGDHNLRNLVVSDGPDSNCDAGSNDPNCLVEFAVVSPPPPPASPSTTVPVVDGELPATGTSPARTMRIVVLLLAGGLLLLQMSRRRRRAAM